MKYLTLSILSILFILQSCQSENKPAPVNQKIDSIEVATLDSAATSKTIESVKTESAKPTQILMVDRYRIFEGSEDPSEILTKDWYDLYEENGQYYLAKVDYTIENGYDECAGIDTKSIVSKRNSLLFLNFPFLKEGKIENLKIVQAEIWPKDQVLYNFKNQKYLLKGYGDINSTEIQTDNGKENVFHDVKNYKLTYSINDGKELSVMKADQFHDTFIKTLFVGDIDRDGKLDFIISNPLDYEESSTLLILSSQIKDDDVEKSSFEQALQFDC